MWNRTLVLLLTALLTCASALPASSASVTAVLGGNVNCSTALDSCFPIPLNASLLCDGTGVKLDCPQYAAPDPLDGTGLRFFGLTNRTNPPRCVQTVDGGTTWTACPVQPFLAAIGLNNAGFAVASNGALIVGARQAPNTCIIRRSTDYGASWSTVYTDTTANEVCQYGNGSPTPNGAHCALTNSYCAIAGIVQGSFNSRMYYSIDNGANWTKGTPFQLVTADSNNSFAVGSAGNSGSWAMFGQSYNSANQRFAYTTGGDWTFTGVIPQPGTGTSLHCPSAFIFNGNQTVLCGPDNGVGDTTKYRFWIQSAGTIGLSRSPVPQNGLTNVQAPNFSGVGFNTSTAYVIGRDSAGTKVSIWITTDAFTTLQQLTTISPATALIGGCCTGDAFTWSGKIYYTSGAGGANAFFGVIR